MFRLATLLILISVPAFAQRAFALTWGSATLAKGTHEAQSWVTLRSGRTDTAYTEFDLRLQAAQGIADRVDTMFGFDVNLAAFGVDSRSVDARISNTWRYSLLKATEAIGIAFVPRIAIGVDIADLEVRVVIDKQFGPVLLALNALVERSQMWSGRTGIDTRFEQSVGVRYQIQEAFSAGLEFRAREAWRGRTYQGTALSAGPTFTYATKRFWLALDFTVQAGADKAVEDRGNGEPLEVRDNERFVGHLVVGVKTAE